MISNKYNIAVYKTDNTWTVDVIVKRMQRTCAQLDLVDVIAVDAQEISEGILMQENYLGLIMPGRNRGKDFGKELGRRGLKAIDQAVYEKGLNTFKICAGSYNAVSLIEYKNQFEPNIITQVNPFPQFQGRAVGAFNELLVNGYIVKNAANYKVPILSADIAEVTYSPALTGLKQPETGHCLYWGGGAFLPDTGAHPDLVSLVSHDAVINLYGQPMTNLAAVVEFNHGKGKVILSNIHPEIDSALFKNAFCMTPKAINQNDIFKADVLKLAASDNLNTLIFERFLQNCLTSIDFTATKNTGNSICINPALC